MSPARAARAHAPTASLGMRHDGRSVGELLRDADHLARTLLLDLTAEDAPALLRSWDQFVDSAAAAWTAIKISTRPASQLVADVGRPPPVDDTDPMMRLHVVTEGIATTLASARWPGSGSGSAAVAQIAGACDRVAYLLETRQVELPLERPDVRADVAAAQMRLMHTVYLTAHATTSALQQYGRQLHRDSRQTRYPVQLATPGPPYAAGPTGRWVQRLGVCEGIAGRYVRGTAGGFAAAVAGEEIPGPDDPGRLHHDLARWDVQVHRTLAADPSPHNLVVASRTQALIADTALRVLAAAQHAGPHPDEDSQALTATVETSGNAWNQLAARWADMAAPGTRADPDLARAAAQLRAAARELTHTSTGKATNEDLLGRVDIARTLDSIQHALAAAVDVAHLTRDASTNPDLTGPARPLSIRAQNETELANAKQPRGYVDQDVLWVTPAAVLANRQVPLPRPVAEHLDQASLRVVRLSERAAASFRAEPSNLAVSPDAVPSVRMHPSAQLPPGPHSTPPPRTVGR